MNKLFISSLSLSMLFLASCVSVSKLPEQNRNLWKEFSCRYKDYLILYKLPVTDYSEVGYTAEKIVETPQKKNILNKDGLQVYNCVFASYYDLGCMSDIPDIPQFALTMHIIDIGNNYHGGLNINNYTEYWMNKVKESNKDRDNLTIKYKIEKNNDREWLHITFLENFDLSEDYNIPIANNRMIIFSISYGIMAKNPEWLSSRRKIAEDIFKSIRIEKNSNKN